MTHMVTYEDTYQVSILDWYYYFDTVQIMFFDTNNDIVYKKIVYFTYILIRHWHAPHPHSKVENYWHTKEKKCLER